MTKLNCFEDLGKVLRTSPRKRMTREEILKKDPKNAVYIDGKLVNKDQSRYARCQELIQYLQTTEVVCHYMVKIYDLWKEINESELERFRKLGFEIRVNKETRIVKPTNPYKR